MQGTFTECDTCRAKPGCPALCAGCLANRTLIGQLERQVRTQQPEVIEGRGQRVTAEQCGWYWREDRSGINVTIVSLSYADAQFVQGCRYIPAEPPTFPPRPQFTTPPKPELVLVKWRSTGNLEWLDRNKLGLSNLCQLDVIDETTGEVKGA